MADNKQTTVKLTSGKRKLNVEWPESGFFQQKKEAFIFNLGDKDTLIRWYEKAKSLESVDKFKDETALNDLYEIEHELINMILGKKSWKKIWKRTGHNVFAILQIVQALSGMIKDGIEESVKMIQDEKSIN